MSVFRGDDARRVGDAVAIFGLEACVERFPPVPRDGVAPPDEDADGCACELAGGVASRVVESAVVLEFGVGVESVARFGVGTVFGVGVVVCEVEECECGSCGGPGSSSSRPVESDDKSGRVIR